MLILMDSFFSLHFIVFGFGFQIQFVLYIQVNTRCKLLLGLKPNKDIELLNSLA